MLVVGCGVGLCWNVGEACRRWSHMCGSWYLPKFLFRGVLYAEEHILLDGPGLAVYLFVNNVKLVGVHGMSCGGTVVVYGGRGLEMFLDSFPQGSARLPNVGADAVDMWALVFADDACLVGFWVLVLGVPQGCSKGVGALEVDLDSSAFA